MAGAKSGPRQWAGARLSGGTRIAVPCHMEDSQTRRVAAFLLGVSLLVPVGCHLVLGYDDRDPTRLGDGAGGAPPATQTSGGAGGAETSAGGGEGGCVDADGDGVTTCDGDCADDDEDVLPGVAERCGDGVDNDCDSATPDLWDADGDGATCAVDCDDDDSEISPLLAEVCDDGKDNDCDAATPDVFDGDADGFLCTLDCDDSESTAYPGNFEICDDGIDNDCNTATPDLCSFHDDFEDGDFVGWVDQGGSYTRSVDSIGASGTNRALRQTGGNTAHRNGLSMSFADLTPVGVSLWVRSSSTAASDGYVAFGPTGAAAVFFSSDGQIWLFGTGSQAVMPYAPNTWYHLYFQFDWVNQMFDLFIDDMLVVAGHPFDTAMPTLQILYLYNHTPGSTAWWDEVIVF